MKFRQMDMGSPFSGFEEPGDRAYAQRPRGRLAFELPPTLPGKAVELGAAIVVGLSPLGVEHAVALEPLKRQEQRSGIDPKDTARMLLDAARNAEAVHRLQAQCLEDEHVQGALDDIGRYVGHVHSAGSSPTVRRLLLDGKRKVTSMPCYDAQSPVAVNNS